MAMEERDEAVMVRKELWLGEGISMGKFFWWKRVVCRWLIVH